MGLLANCPKCGTIYATGTPCPNCNEGASSGGDAAAQKDGLMAEYARRKEQHTYAYAAYMCRMMAAGLVAVLGIAFLILWKRQAAVFFIGFLFLFAAVVSVVAHSVLLKYKEYLELHCPACDARLDELPMSAGQCPACLVRLMEK